MAGRIDGRKERKMKAMVIEPLEEPREIELEADEEGSCLRSMQRIVGGPIEHFDLLFGNEPCLVVNDEGLLIGLAPNRAVYATSRMEEEGCLSAFDFTTPVKEGDPYVILFGPILAVSYDEEGNARDMNEEECEKVRELFGGEESVTSGAIELMRLLSTR